MTDGKPDWMNKRQTGADYEAQAAEWLEEQGFRILERNYRCRQGEIDLIAMDGACLVFVEVKYRSGSRSGHPGEAVDVRKQRRIARTAVHYCYKNKIPDTQACRFDVLGILGDEIEYYKNAFELQS